MERHLSRLFLESTQYLAPLQGVELDAGLEEDPSLLSAACAEPFLANLHSALQKAHPEAGAPDWRIKSWGLSCWQPIYLALICVYHLKRIPNSLGRLHQTQQQAYVAGYTLPDGEWLAGEHEALVQHTAEQLKTLFAACNPKQFADLKAKKALWESHGHNELELLSASSIQDHIGSDRYAGGLLDRKGGHIQPLNLVLGQAKAFEKIGGQIFEDSEVIRLEHGKPGRVMTKQGVVVADTIVVAGNAYMFGLLPEVEKKAMPCGTQVIATEPLPVDIQKKLLPTGHCVEDCNYLLDYYRLSGDGRLIYGGGATYGARDPGKIESIIVPKMLKTYPVLQNVKIDFAWTGNFLLTMMRMPQVGKIGDNLYYAQGYSGYGVTNSHLMGEILSDAIDGDTERFDVFASMPQYQFPGGRMLRIPYTVAGGVYYNMRDRLGI